MKYAYSQSHLVTITPDSCDTISITITISKLMIEILMVYVTDSDTVC